MSKPRALNYPNPVKIAVQEDDFRLTAARFRIGGEMNVQPVFGMPGMAETWLETYLDSRPPNTWTEDGSWPEVFYVIVPADLPLS